jgi:hypothetical protein
MLRSGEIGDFCDVRLNCMRGDPYLFHCIAAEN